MLRCSSVAFRDDSEAARSRADALERENKQLREQLAKARAAAKDGAKAEEAPLPQPKPALWIVAGLAAALGGPFLCIRLHLPLVLIAASASAGLFLLAVGMVKAFVLVVPPNEILVLSGRAHRRHDGEMIGYRVVSGGRAIRVPFLERADSMSVESMSVIVSPGTAYTKASVPTNIEGVVTVKIAGHAPTVHNAIERFLGRDKQEIATVARETIEGHLRGVCALLTFDAIHGDPVRFASQVIAEAERDFEKLGLDLDTLVIKRVEKNC
jgi:uncharacterized membrane protein YqiK